MNPPDIFIEEWLEAERQLGPIGIGLQPDGSVTPEQYADMRNLPLHRAQRILRSMVRSGLARRERWGRYHVYWLIHEKA